MAKNANLNKAKDKKVDEFYTRRSDIENELSYYSEHFKGKTVYCNCDDPEWSEFWQFFRRNFKPWGLKKLIATHYEPDEKNYAYMLEISEDTNGDGVVDWKDEPTITQIPCNGDFRSAYCIGLLKQADIIVTNPPFSLWRQYIQQLFEYKKKFLIIGSENNLSYNEIFHYVQDNEMWIGYTHPKIFRVPDGSTGKSVYMEDGICYQKFGNVCWYTNLDIKKRHDFIDLRGNYYNKDDFPMLDNYPAIYVKRVSDIPCDYEGIMGVPISYLSQYNPEQVQLLGIVSAPKNQGSLNLGKDYSKYIGHKQSGELNGRTGSTFGRNAVLIGDDGHHDYYEYNGVRVQSVYPRAFIKLKNPESRRYINED